MKYGWIDHAKMNAHAKSTIYKREMQLVTWCGCGSTPRVNLTRLQAEFSCFLLAHNFVVSNASFHYLSISIFFEFFK